MAVITVSRRHALLVSCQSDQILKPAPFVFLPLPTSFPNIPTLSLSLFSLPFNPVSFTSSFSPLPLSSSLPSTFSFLYPLSFTPTPLLSSSLFSLLSFYYPSFLSSPSLSLRLPACFNAYILTILRANLSFYSSSTFLKYTCLTSWLLQDFSQNLSTKLYTCTCLSALA